MRLLKENKTIVEATKAMIHDKILPMFLWEEASKIVVCVENIFPHKILKNMTLKEAFPTI